MRKVTMIPASINPLTRMPSMATRKRRVAGYARVSTDSDEQFTSYEAQIDYYTRFIQSKPEWKFVKVYTDEGISGTNTKRREDFKEMISDALAGKIDLIVTKSVSRFARNTVDSLVTIRKLKENGVECFFEKEGIYTFDGKGKLLITIMSSLAQEESRSISENITWGQRKRFSDGKVSMPYKRFLGYCKGEEGQPAIVEEEAAVVRLIYRLFLEGKTQADICKYLEELGIPSPSGKSKWSKTTVTSILTNKKYKGDALLHSGLSGEEDEAQRGRSAPILCGEKPSAHYQAGRVGSCAGRVCQTKSSGQHLQRKSTLSAKLVCEDCGSFYGSKVWHSTDKYRRSIWQCNNKFSNETHCCTPTLDTETVQEQFITAYNRLMQDRRLIVEDCELMRTSLTDFTLLDSQIEEAEAETQLVAELVNGLVRENASTAQSQDAYPRKYEALTQRYEAAKAELDQLQKERPLRSQQDKAVALFIRTLKKQPEVLDAWNDTVWTMMVEKAIVHRNGSITFVFYNDTEIAVEKQAV